MGASYALTPQARAAPALTLVNRLHFGANPSVAGPTQTDVQAFEPTRPAHRRWALGDHLLYLSPQSTDFSALRWCLAPPSACSLIRARPAGCSFRWS